jgi:hypothetical protein
MSCSIPLEDRVAAILDVIQEGLDAIGRALALVLVELEISIAPVDGYGPVALDVAQPGDREAGVLADAVLRGPHLDDVDVALGDVGLNLDLLPQVLGHPHEPRGGCGGDLSQGAASHKRCH